MLFKKQFRNALVADLGYGFSDANRITKASKTKYREIIEKLPEFEKEDRFKTNIVNCALLILSENIHWHPAVRIVTVDIRRRDWCEYINDKYNNNCSDTLRDRVSCDSDRKSDGKAFIGVKVSVHDNGRGICADM